jgi:hypothetical protein
MKMTFAGVELNVPPKRNQFGSDYVYREVVKETAKAYLIRTKCFRFSDAIKFQWIGKSVCKVDENGDVFCPTWLVDEGINDKYWTTIATKQ